MVDLTTHFKRIFGSKKAYFSLLALLLFTTPALAAQWSQPPEIIYPSMAPYTASTPSIAADANGNSVAVWFDISGSGSFQAATLASGSVNAKGQPNWILTSPITSSNVQDPYSPYTQTVGMDANGNATAIWTDGTNVYTSTLALGSTTWSDPLLINTPSDNETTSNPSIAVAANGNAIASWSSASQPYDYTLFANIFDYQTQSWLGEGEVNILTGAFEYNVGLNQILVDPFGNGLIILSATSDNVQAISYSVETNTWTQIASLATTSIVSAAGAIDSQGNATIVWIEENNTINAATLLFNQTVLTNQILLSSTANPSYTAPALTANSVGNVLVLWTDISGNLAAARYTFSQQTWTILPLLDLQGSNPSFISLSGDSLGNNIASWTIFGLNANYIQSAALAAGQSHWTLLTQISPNDSFSSFSKIILTASGNGIIVWENDLNADTGSIESSNFLNLFLLPPPTFPTYFSGKIIKAKFGKSWDRIHQINWGASKNPSIVEYRLYRNSKLIATLPGNQPSYTYNDTHRKKKVKDRYKLISVNADGSTNSPLFVVLK